MLTKNVLADTKRHRVHIPNRLQIIVTEVTTSYNSPSSLTSLSVVLLRTYRCHTEIKYLDRHLQYSTKPILVDMLDQNGLRYNSLQFGKICKYK